MSQTISNLGGSSSPRERLKRIEDPFNEVKHRFMHVYLHQTGVVKPMFIDVNKMFMRSVNKGDWHGASQYVHTRGEAGSSDLLYSTVMYILMPLSFQVRQRIYTRSLICCNCIFKFTWRSGWLPDHIHLADDWASARVGVAPSRLGPVRFSWKIC